MPLVMQQMNPEYFVVAPCAPQKPGTASGYILFQLVFMMQTAQDVLNCDPTIPRQSMSRMQLRKASRWRRLRGSWTQARMWASFIIVSHPGPQDSTELSFVERDHEIQALSSYRSHQSFTVGIRLRCPDRRTQYSESEGAFHFRVQLRRKDGIAVVDEELIGMIARNGVPQLLERPLR